MTLTALGEVISIFQSCNMEAQDKLKMRFLKMLFLESSIQICYNVFTHPLWDYMVPGRNNEC